MIEVYGELVCSTYERRVVNGKIKLSFFRKMSYRLLKVNDIINDDYQNTDEYKRGIYERLEGAKNRNDEEMIEFYLLCLRMLED